MSGKQKEDLLPEILEKANRILERSDEILTKLDNKSEYISGKEAARMLDISYNHFINRRAQEFPSRKRENGRTEFERKAIEAVINQRVAS